ncbi:MAG: glycoside hydrolase family 16 protein [Prevotella sp.]|nr:glycoside hydrolase family 16 protein [Prevotella sp.]
MMKYRKQLIGSLVAGVAAICIVMSFTSATADDNVLSNEGYQLVFADEFNQPNGSQPDSKKWKRCRRNPSRWARWISDSKKVVFVKNGKLVCRAIPNKDLKTDTAAMLTGAIETMGMYEMKYGKVEVRMRTNVKSGNSPAVWIRNDPSRHKLYSEIDIVEAFGKKKETVHTIHSQYTVNTPKHKEKNMFRHQIDVTKWHVYGMAWTPREVVWTVDGKVVGRYSKSSDAQLLANGQWTFDQPMFLRLNQSVCNGSIAGVPNTKSTYVTEFDWIRVYQKKR